LQARPKRTASEVAHGVGSNRHRKEPTMSTLTKQSDTTHALDHTLLFVIHGAIRTDLDRLRVPPRAGGD
jgi:hypothetical protein